MIEYINRLMKEVTLMDNIILFAPVFLVVFFGLIIVPLATALKKGGGGPSDKNNRRNTSFGKQVNEIHVKDAATERKHRLDQLKSLYEAGMMERDEYDERVSCVEEEYSRRRYN